MPWPKPQRIDKYVEPVPDDIVDKLKQQDIATLEKIIENVHEHKTIFKIIDQNGFSLNGNPFFP